MIWLECDTSIQELPDDLVQRYAGEQYTRRQDQIVRVLCKLLQIGLQHKVCGGA